MVAFPLLSAALRRAVGAAPLLTRPVLGPPPRNDRGAAIDPMLFTALRLLGASGRPTLDELGPERARRELTGLAELVDVPVTPLPRVEDRSLEGPAGPIPIRLYAPREGGALPALVYFHGGGFVLGDLESHERTCRFLAQRAEVAVVAVDYRLAPEHPFPAAVEDSLAAFREVRERAASLGLDPARLAVGGDSAGGNLAAVVCQQIPAEERPCFQLLIYPATDLSRSSESHRTFREGYFLTGPMMDWFVANYLTRAEQERDPRASPLAVADLSGLPPAHVAVAGFDPLRDEGEAYARNLMAAGVPTSLRCYESLIHGFVAMGGLSRAARWALEDLGDVLAARLRA